MNVVRTEIRDSRNRTGRKSGGTECINAWMDNRCKERTVHAFSRPRKRASHSAHKGSSLTHSCTLFTFCSTLLKYVKSRISVRITFMASGVPGLSCSLSPSSFLRLMCITCSQLVPLEITRGEARSHRVSGAEQLFLFLVKDQQVCSIGLIELGDLDVFLWSLLHHCLLDQIVERVGAKSKPDGSHNE